MGRRVVGPYGAVGKVRKLGETREEDGGSRAAEVVGPYEAEGEAAALGRLRRKQKL